MYYLVRFQAYTPPSIQSPLLSYHVLLGKVAGLYPSQSPVLSYHVLLGMVPGLLYPSLKIQSPLLSYHVLLGMVPGPLYPFLNPVTRAFLPCITW